MNRYSRLDNTSPAQQALKEDSVNVGRSAHDCSHIVCGNTLLGMLTPVLTMEVVLNEDIDINLASLIEFRNPSTRQLFNSFRVYFHGYFNALTDLWEGAKNWLDNGRTGKIELTRPNLIYDVTCERTLSGTTYQCKSNACTPMSLLNFFGLPVEYIQSNVKSDNNPRPPIRQFECATEIGKGESGYTKDTIAKVNNHPDYFPADCAFAYQKNWRDFYAPKNLMSSNKKWFPDNEDHFILSYSCTDACAIKYEDEKLTGITEAATKYNQSLNLACGTHAAINTFTPGCHCPEGGSSDDISAWPNLSAIKFRQFRGDRFTTASPFPDLIRGDIPSINLTKDKFIDKMQYSVSDDETVQNEMWWGPGGSIEPEGDTPMEESYISFPLPSISVTMSDLYTLETLTAFRRKMGMTNGDYSEMMNSQFGTRPKIHSRTGTYIGGFYQDFALSSVVQQSESNETPLGTKAGQGISSGSGRIGHIHTTDFGWIQVYMSIVCDVYYTQGIPRQFSKKSNLEMYFPLFNNLPAQAILNKEIRYPDSDVTANNPFSYEDRFAEYKSIPNHVNGFMGLTYDIAAYDASRVIARRFAQQPSFNSRFTTMIPENIDYNVFTVPDEPPFDYSVGFSIRRVFPGPYVAIEGSLSSPKLNA